MTSGIYVYGIVETGALHPGVRADGVAGAPPALLAVGGLTAIVCGVDVAEFEGAALERNAATPGWLEQKVRAHEAVLEDALERAAVVPMRFGSIFSSPEGLHRMLTEHAGEFGVALARVRDRTEWGVKLHADTARMVDALSGAPTETGSGRGYLEQRKAQLDAGNRAAQVAAEVAAQTHESLSELADEAVTLAGRGHEVLNGAYLVPHDGREAFMRRVEGLQARHGDAFTFEVTGPWPPYNFTDADVGGPRS